MGLGSISFSRKRQHAVTWSWAAVGGGECQPSLQVPGAAHPHRGQEECDEGAEWSREGVEQGREWDWMGVDPGLKGAAASTAALPPMSSPLLGSIHQPGSTWTSTRQAAGTDPSRPIPAPQACLREPQHLRERMFSGISRGGEGSVWGH